ncbi:hypothetical protein MLD38_021185 [Melastoma candidum]|uniref:Uncharacterized protein n=1 Tax=Melastoma candidum TaxID=119954 RepID=A0ACB9QFJ4_9MYRT|nr:hypothetical protein MLD38_021185 [Melastoma candidum]
MLSKEVFDPHGFDQSDYYDEIEADMKREQERKEQARKRNQQIEFVSAGAQAAVAAAIQKVNISVTAVGDSLRSADAVSRDGRQKKSKWDKVDDDRMIPLPPVGKESISATATVHAGTLSTSNAGSGYTAFAQQRRREAEERRSVDKKLDRRS